MLNFTLAFLKVKNKIICNLHSVDLLHVSLDFIYIQPKDIWDIWFYLCKKGKNNFRFSSGQLKSTPVLLREKKKNQTNLYIFCSFQVVIFCTW